MHIICIIPLEVLLLILLPGCTTLPGTAERPFPSIEGSTRRQSQVEGAPRCCDEPWDFTGSRVACVQTKPMGKSKKKGQMLSHGDRSIGSLSRSRKRSWSTSMTTKCTPSMRKPATWENLSLGFGYWLGSLWKFGCHPTKIARGWGQIFHFSDASLDKWYPHCRVCVIIHMCQYETLIITPIRNITMKKHHIQTWHYNGDCSIIVGLLIHY